MNAKLTKKEAKTSPNIENTTREGEKGSKGRTPNAKMTRAERRSIQESQKAAKEAKKGAKSDTLDDTKV